MTTLATDTPERLLGMVERLKRQDGFDDVVASLTAGHAATLDGVWGSSCALAAAALAEQSPGVLLVVTPSQDEVDTLADDLTLFSPLTAERFPAYESLPGEQVVHDEVFGERVRLLKLLRSDGSGQLPGATAAGATAGLPSSASPHPSPLPKGEGTDTVPSSAGPAPSPGLVQPPGAVVVASIQSLLQPVPAPAELDRATLRLEVGKPRDPDELAAWLAASRFHATTAVELPGEFSIRGGIVDIFAPDWSDPVRVEFFGDEIDSLRRFDIASQRSLAELGQVDVTALDPSAACSGHLADYLPTGATAGLSRTSGATAGLSSSASPHPNPLAAGEGTDAWIMLVEPERLDEAGRRHLERLDAPRHFHGVADVMRRLTQWPTVTASALATASMETTCRLNIESVEQFSGDINRVRDELDGLGTDQDVHVVCQTEAEASRVWEVLAETRLAEREQLHLTIGELGAGFRLVPDRIVLLSSAELFRREDLRRRRRRHAGRAIDSFLELRSGDLVVHVAHGIARYRGMKLLEKGAQREEHLELEFHGGTRLYVPSSKIGLVQKYVGGSKSRPSLARLGGRSWVKQKAKVERAVTDMAADMLQLQAAREGRPGITFPGDTQWQQEFDASFPYVETPDQMVTIESIKADMTRSRPMDRLLCGDVGYGKTEVAMRAAFKAVDAGYQVAVLVPTTVLADQHARTFAARMAEFPFEIAALSRFATRAEQAATIRRLAEGSVDICIGTHRLVQPDVRFQNLGLVIIDEEQRFGVAVKEQLKALRHSVDVLTMTATPIPRTLHMGLLGVRDISNLETPPEDRLAVETRVTRFKAEMVRHAVMRELNRDGQVYFVHNRVQDIHSVARRLQEIVPEATIAVGHGQMPEHELEAVMLDFVARRCDILVATTIVESGLDIPNANTMFIDEADRYGLADLHQLRGRVGRYKHRAYCYLLVDPTKNLSPTAAKRLRAIEEFSHMGAGFQIAMRDLEIRGAGNILGTEQSGHIATVGYELYCSLLAEAVRRLKNLPPEESVDVDVDLPVEAHIPASYVPDLRAKIDLYRRLARVASLAELGDLRTELSDRFGPPPEVVRRLLSLSELRVIAHAWGVTSIHLEPPYVALGYSSAERIRRLVAETGGELRVVDDRSAYVTLPQDVTEGRPLLEWLKSLLQSR